MGNERREGRKEGRKEGRRRKVRKWGIDDIYVMFYDIFLLTYFWLDLC
jgi:hypothetical protein